MAWSFDMSKAPRGRYRVLAAGRDGQGARKVFERQQIIAASSCGVVTISYWIDDQKRWSMFTRENPPIAWAPYDGPRLVVDAGKARKVHDLPSHPTMQESWFQRHLRERRAAA